VGTGPPEAIQMYEGLAKSLGLQRTVFLGPKSALEKTWLKEITKMFAKPSG